LLKLVSTATEAGVEILYDGMLPIVVAEMTLLVHDFTSTEKVVETFKPVNSGKLANEASTVNEWVAIRAIVVVGPNFSVIVAAESSKVRLDVPLTRFEFVAPTTPIKA
jgi:hypothetical protein